jgi:hypothetical protein
MHKIGGLAPVGLRTVRSASPATQRSFFLYSTSNPYLLFLWLLGRSEQLANRFGSFALWNLKA